MGMVLCPLFSGSSGNAIFVGSEKTAILVDAGMSGKVIEKALDGIGVNPNTIGGILITHEHSDHIKGAGVLSRRFNIPIFANANTWEAMHEKIGDIASKNQRVFDSCGDFFIDDMNIAPFKTPHDAADSVGFCFYCKGKKVSIVTDLGYVPNSVLNAVEKSDLLLLESNHDPDMLMHSRYPYDLKRRIRSKRGHLSNQEAAKALIKLHEKGLKKAFLGHMSGENNMEDILRQTIYQELIDEGIEVGRDIQLAIAYRDRVSLAVKVGE